MLISVFTPTNSLIYLEEAWKSLKNQTYKEFEWVIVPNGDLKTIPRSITADPRVKVFPTSEIFDNVGALKKFACEHCRGELLVEFDHDDLLMPRCLERLALATDVTKAQFLFSDFAPVNEKMEPVVYGADWGWETYNVTYKGHLLKAAKAFAVDPCGLCCLQFTPNHVRAWTRKGYEQAGGHSAELPVADDYDLILRGYVAGLEMIQIKECLYVYRTHETSTSKQKNADIQKLQYEIFNQRVAAVVAEWCNRNKYQRLELAISTGQISDLDIVYPLRGAAGRTVGATNEYFFPGLSDLPENSVGELRCHGMLPYLDRHLIMPFFEACYKALAPGGWFRITVPSADYSGGFANPLYRSYWNQLTFKTFTNKTAASMAGGHKCRFQYLRVWDTWDNAEERDSKMIRTCVDLVALKGQKQPGVVEI